MEKLHHELGKHPYFVKGADKRQWTVEFGELRAHFNQYNEAYTDQLTNLPMCIYCCSTFGGFHSITGVLHYAGPVVYQIEKFLEKNKDVQQDMFFDFLEVSSSPFCREIAKYRVRSSIYVYSCLALVHKL